MEIEVKEVSSSKETRRFVIIPPSGSNEYHEIKDYIADRMQEAGVLKKALIDKAYDLVIKNTEVTVKIVEKESN